MCGKITVAFRAMGFSMEDLVTSDQTHTTNVRIVGEADRGNGITKPRPYQDVDGMITDVPGLVLATFYADCVPLYFVDTVHRCAAPFSFRMAGHRGKNRCCDCTKMREAYGIRPEDILAAVAVHMSGVL